MEELKVSDRIELLIHASKTDVKSKESSAVYYLAMANSDELEDIYAICDYYEQYMDTLEGHPVTIQTSTLFNHGCKDAPDFAQNPYNKDVADISVLVHDCEDESIDFTAEELGMWLLSKLPETFSHYEYAKSYTEKYGDRADAYMKMRIEEYDECIKPAPKNKDLEGRQ